MTFFGKNKLAYAVVQIEEISTNGDFVALCYAHVLLVNMVGVSVLGVVTAAASD